MYSDILIAGILIFHGFLCWNVIHPLWYRGEEDNASITALAKAIRLGNTINAIAIELKRAPSTPIYIEESLSSVAQIRDRLNLDVDLVAIVRLATISCTFS